MSLRYANDKILLHAKDAECVTCRLQPGILCDFTIEIYITYRYM